MSDSEVPKQEPKLTPIAKTAVNLLMAEFEPCENIVEADLRITPNQLLERVYGTTELPYDAYDAVYTILTEKGYTMKSEGSGNDVQFLWLFKNRS